MAWVWNKRGAEATKEVTRDRGNRKRTHVTCHHVMQRGAHEWVLGQGEHFPVHVQFRKLLLGVCGMHGRG